MRKTETNEDRRQGKKEMRRGEKTRREEASGDALQWRWLPCQTQTWLGLALRGASRRFGAEPTGRSPLRRWRAERRLPVQNEPIGVDLTDARLIFLITHYYYYLHFIKSPYCNTNLITMTDCVLFVPFSVNKVSHFIWIFSIDT